MVIMITNLLAVSPPGRHKSLEGDEIEF